MRRESSPRIAASFLVIRDPKEAEDDGHTRNPTSKPEEEKMRTLKVSVISLVICSVLMGGLFAGCGGGGAHVQQTDQTIGKELLDLQQAYEKGIITEKEYNRAKKEILDRK
jgi:hypothetical protein